MNEMQQESSAQRVARLNEFARSRNPGLVGVEVVTRELDKVVGRLEVTAHFVAGATTSEHR